MAFISFYIGRKKIIKIYILSFLLLIFLIILYKKRNYIKLSNIKRIGVVSLYNHNNIGNNLVKFSIYTKLKEYGYEPIIIAFSGKNIYFLKKYVKLKELKKSYSELLEKDYDILMVNSDQTWNGNKKNTTNLLNYGYLQFAEKWKIPRFVYGASLGVNYWKFSKEFDEIARKLLKKFKGISVREKGAIKLVKSHLGIQPELVMDPTFIIDKKYYLDLIKNFKSNFNFKNKFLCIYQLDRNIIIDKLIKKVRKKLKLKIYKINRYKSNYIENFIFYINGSSSVLTDSFHGTIFSIIFNKPFISFVNKKRGIDRFISLIETFNLRERIVFLKNATKVNISLLEEPLNINQSLLNNLKNFSINYLEKNLGIKKY